MPNPDREKAYKQLREKAEKMAVAIRDKMGEETSIFDLCCFSALTLLQAQHLFPDYGRMFAMVVRDCITLQIDSQIAIEDGTNKVEEPRKKVSNILGMDGKPIQ